MRQNLARAPQRQHNRAELLPDGSRFFPPMLEAIAHARQTVALELYWMATSSLATRFIDALVGAAGRGVAVFVLLDDYGSADLQHDDRQRLTDAGIALALYNPLHLRGGRTNLGRDHRKLLLVDDALAFVGGAGICDAFDGADGWRENMLRVEGECVADWWHLFASNWRDWSAVAAPPVPAVRAVGTTPGRVIAGGPDAGKRPIKARAINDIRRARQRVWLATPYFLPPVKLRRALVRACHHGCDVRLLLPTPKTSDVPAVQAAGRRHYERLLRAGVRVFEYHERTTHQKVLLADDRVMLGSSNLDRWGLRCNLEANQALVSARGAEEVAQMLEGDFAASQEHQLSTWRQRSLVTRWREYFWSWVAMRSTRFAYRRRLHHRARSRRA